MADVSTYRRALVSYAAPGIMVNVGEVRAASDPVVTANPAYWAALTDGELTSGNEGISPI
jgi:alpha-D-ribose 1-methylphosphonate 5-triphosphate synthase subunit PhnH